MSVPRGSGRAAVSLTALASFVTLMAGACASPSTEAERLGSADDPIIGGKLDTTHKGVVSLLKQVQGGYFPSCSGTLLTRNLVLTARHCIADLDSPDGSSVQCGQTEFDDNESASSLLVSIEANVGSEGLDPYRVAQVWVPPGSSAVCGRDIALLLLSGSGIPASAAQPIEPGFAAEVKPEAVFAAIGYGLQDPNDERGETAGHRMSVTDATVFCAGRACGSPLVTEGEWIADSPVCSGDSGGPALDQAGRVVGVTSRGDPECTVGIYSSVYSWRAFITQGAVDAAEAGNYTPPTWAGGATEPSGTGGTGNTGAAGTPGTGTGGAGSGGSSAMGGAPIIAGNGSGATSPMSPTIDPLGLACTGSCPGAYKCWAENGMPPGICVPACTPAASTCPTDYTCSDKLEACVPARVLQTTKAKDSSGCSMAGPAPSASSALLWLAAALVAVIRPRRKRARDASAGRPHRAG